jgi:hypothetical protein
MLPALRVGLLSLCLATACTSSPAVPGKDAGAPDADAPDAADAGLPPPLPWSPGAFTPLPEDDVLQVNHVQAKGTHNSYHVETAGNTLADWHYTMAPLDVQLGAQGVRQLELDLHLTSLDDDFEIFHLELLDEGTTCRKLRDCLRTIGEWSGAHPDHQPIYLQFEPKNGFTPDTPEAYFAKLEAEILSVLVKPRLVTPDEVQGDAATLGAAVSQGGWPTLAKTRGRILMAFDNTDVVRDAYSRQGTSLKGRLLFTAALAGDALAALAILNDPVADAPAIQAALQANMLVRTMTDAPGDPDATAQAGLTAGLSVGAHWLSTNFPAPVPGMSFVEVIPGGTPSRCNPVTAPSACVAQDIEDLKP